MLSPLRVKPTSPRRKKRPDSMRRPSYSTTSRLSFASSRIVTRAGAARIFSCASGSIVRTSRPSRSRRPEYVAVSGPLASLACSSKSPAFLPRLRPAERKYLPFMARSSRPARPASKLHRQVACSPQEPRADPRRNCPVPRQRPTTACRGARASLSRVISEAFGCCCAVACEGSSGVKTSSRPQAVIVVEVRCIEVYCASRARARPDFPPRPSERGYPRSPRDLATLAARRPRTTCARCCATPMGGRRGRAGPTFSTA